MSPDSVHVVVAFVQPFLLENVVDSLRLVPRFPGMSVSEVRGFGRRFAHAPGRGEATEVEPFEERSRIEICCRGSELKPILDALSASAHTGNAGDGMIFALPLERAIRIRTREEGSEALLSGCDDGNPHD